ncbi:MAG: hypothetical protein H6747_16460 [Deltaproteobacteria bacterium]|nr:hypothetical protein [Deltaproteobacteria bacterium]
MSLLQTIIAEGQAAGAPDNSTVSVVRALLLVTEAALGPEPRFDKTALLALPSAKARLEQMWADPARRRLVCQGGLQLLAAVEVLVDGHHLSAGERKLGDALLGMAYGSSSPEGADAA